MIFAVDLMINPSTTFYSPSLILSTSLTQNSSSYSNSPEKMQKERDAVEVCELIRILHEANVEEQKQKERLETP